MLLDPYPDSSVVLACGPPVLRLALEFLVTLQVIFADHYFTPQGMPDKISGAAQMLAYVGHACLSGISIMFGDPMTERCPAVALAVAVPEKIPTTFWVAWQQQPGAFSLMPKRHVPLVALRKQIAKR